MVMKKIFFQWKRVQTERIANVNYELVCSIIPFPYLFAYLFSKRTLQYIFSLQRSGKYSRKKTGKYLRYAQSVSNTKRVCTDRDSRG